MQALYLWPDQPVPSLFVLWLVSAIFLWAAREPALELLENLGNLLRSGFEGLAERCRGAAQEIRKRSRAALLAAGKLDAQAKLERELQRVDSAFSDKLGQYSRLHRRLDDLLVELEGDYERCSEVPPEVPGWSTAVAAISRIPTPGDPNVQKVLESIRRSSQDAEKKALRAYREDTARRHKALGQMVPRWRDVRGLMERMREAAARALDATRRIHGYVEEYDKVRREQEVAARTLTYSAFKLLATSLIVLGVALGGAFVNFQLIALPMSELVPAAARVGGVPVSQVSALVIVLMETALGIFLMEMLGITDLFPKLHSVPASRRKLILGLSLGGLFFLASVESSLAVLREQIVEADAALKLSLAGEEGRLVTRASSSLIPVVGQAVLGFVLPWVLALVAIPLEMLFDSARHVFAALAAVLLQALGQLSSLAAHAAGLLTKMISQLALVYISIPLRIEQAIRGAGGDGSAGGGGARPGRERAAEVTAS